MANVKKNLNADADRKVEEWNHYTVADGEWLNDHDILPLSARDEYLAEEIDKLTDRVDVLAGGTGLTMKVTNGEAAGIVSAVEISNVYEGDGESKTTTNLRKHTIKTDSGKEIDEYAFASLPTGEGVKGFTKDGYFQDISVLTDAVTLTGDGTNNKPLGVSDDGSYLARSIHHGSQTMNTSAYAIGNNVTAYDKNFAFGQNINAYHTSGDTNTNVVIGHDLDAYDAFVIGSKSTAHSGFSIGINNNVSASVSIGTGLTTNNGINIGTNNKVQNAVAIGTQNTSYSTTDAGAFTIGTNNNVSGGFAIGAENSAYRGKPNLFGCKNTANSSCLIHGDENIANAGIIFGSRNTLTDDGIIFGCENGAKSGIVFGSKIQSSGGIGIGTRMTLESTGCIGVGNGVTMSNGGVAVGENISTNSAIAFGIYNTVKSNSVGIGRQLSIIENNSYAFGDSIGAENDSIGIGHFITAKNKNILIGKNIGNVNNKSNLTMIGYGSEDTAKPTPYVSNDSTVSFATINGDAFTMKSGIKGGNQSFVSAYTFLGMITRPTPMYDANNNVIGYNSNNSVARTTNICGEIEDIWNAIRYSNIPRAPVVENTDFYLRANNEKIWWQQGTLPSNLPLSNGTYLMTVNNGSCEWTPYVPSSTNFAHHNRTVSQEQLSYLGTNHETLQNNYYSLLNLLTTFFYAKSSNEYGADPSQLNAIAAGVKALKTGWGLTNYNLR